MLGGMRAIMPTGEDSEQGDPPKPRKKKRKKMARNESVGQELRDLFAENEDETPVEESFQGRLHTPTPSLQERLRSPQEDETLWDALGESEDGAVAGDDDGDADADVEDASVEGVEGEQDAVTQEASEISCNECPLSEHAEACETCLFHLEGDELREGLAAMLEAVALADPVSRARKRMDDAAKRGGLDEMIQRTATRVKSLKDKDKAKGMVTVLEQLIAQLSTLRRQAMAKSS
jgi:hypothetical protein